MNKTQKKGKKKQNDEAENEYKKKKAEEKQEEKDRLKRLYITIMVGGIFAILNFTKNPFNSSQ